MAKDPHAFALRISPWAQGLLSRSSGDVRQVGRNVDLAVAGRGVRLSERDPRRLGARSPRVHVQSDGEYFDLREWLGLIDWPHQDPGGADQLEALDVLLERSELDDPAVPALLRQARTRWIDSLGEVAADPGAPDWPVDVPSPDQLSRLDEGLLSAGYNTGWIVRDAEQAPIGVVRQHGPTRVQLTVYNGTPVVQIASWPNDSWRPLHLLSETYGLPIDTVSDVLDLATRFTDRSFACSPQPKWAATNIAAFHSQLHPEPDTGPGPGEIHYVIDQRHPSDYLDPHGWAHVNTLKRNVDTWHDHPDVARVGRKRIPPIMATDAVSKFFNPEAVDACRPLAVDTDWFGFTVEGGLFGAPLVPGVARGNPIDYARSVTARFRSVPGGIVIHPLQIMRPGQLLFDGSQIIVDAAGAEHLNTQLPKLTLRPAWDPS